MDPFPIHKVLVRASLLRPSWISPNEYLLVHQHDDGTLTETWIPICLQRKRDGKIDFSRAEGPELVQTTSTPSLFVVW